MSRIGKKIIYIPKDIAVNIENDQIIVKGKHGSLVKSISKNLEVILKDNTIKINRLDDSKESRSLHGLIRALIQNMIIGVNEKFSKVLIAEGVGYKFQIEKSELILNVGFSHPVKFSIPSDLTLKLESPTKLNISGIDKEQVGFLAAKIRDIRPPEPYKGKGLLYEGEKIIRKAGKTGK